jgi:isopentenyl diphosphate isomerase/L-lactate dehydrogenase-like FMN-dependent dehydrogenase
VAEMIEITQTELRIAMFAAGISSLAALKNTPHIMKMS